MTITICDSIFFLNCKFINNNNDPALILLNEIDSLDVTYDGKN